MGIYKEWEDRIENQNNMDYIKAYYLKEAEGYKHILGNKINVLNGTVRQISTELNLDIIETAGFISGINSSLKNEIDVESLKAYSTVNMEIDYEKLLWNMYASKASWLYELDEWEDIFDKEKRKEIKKDYVDSVTAKSEKIGRNDPCPCGSGKKYKKCCGR